MFIKQPQSIMSDSILQKYVDAALLGTKIIQSEEDFGNLNKASTQLVKKLTQKKRKPDLISFILLGINPNIRPEEPLLDEVKTIIKDNNKLFVSRSKDKAVTVIRAVILHALEQMAKENMAISSAIYLIGSKCLEYVANQDKEKSVVKNFLIDTGVKVENYSTDLWKIQPVQFKNTQKPKYQTSDLPAKLTNGTSDTLQRTFSSLDDLKNNIGVRNQQNRIVQVTNAENFNIWYRNTFATSISHAITNEITSKINSIRTPLNEHLESFEEEIKVHIESLRKNINEATENLVNGTNSLRNRDQIVWWKETLFSNSTKKSYRDFENEAVRNIVMAHDYFLLVPSYCPLSVDYFFKETVMKMEVSSDEISFEEILQLLEDEESAAITQIWNSYEKTDKIMPVPEFINGFVHGNYSADEFEKLTYVNPSDKIKLTDLGLWVFHYLQSKHLLK